MSDLDIKMATVIEEAKLIGLFGMCMNSDAQKTLCYILSIISTLYVSRL